MFKSIRRIAILKGRIRISKRRIREQKVLKLFIGSFFNFLIRRFKKKNKRRFIMDGLGLILRKVN